MTAKSPHAFPLPGGSDGLNQRQFYAAMALLSAGHFLRGAPSPEEVAAWSVRQADALIETERRTAR